MGEGENRCDMVGEPFLSFESLRTNGQPRLCDGLGGREGWFGGGENRCDMVGEPFLSFERPREAPFVSTITPTKGAIHNFSCQPRFDR